MKFALLSLVVFLTVSLIHVENGYASETNFKLEAGDALNLEDLDFQHANMDSVFSKLAYLKEYRLGAATNRYLKSAPYILRRYYLYNIDDATIIEHYMKNELITVSKGDMYGDVISIERTSPPKDLKNPNKGNLAYWSNENIAFNAISTRSTPDDDVFMVRFKSDKYGQDVYQNLLSMLKNNLKNAQSKDVSKATTLLSYEWYMNDKIIQISYDKTALENNLELTMYFLNAHTKGYLKQFNH